MPFLYPFFALKKSSAGFLLKPRGSLDPRAHNAAALETTLTKRRRVSTIFLRNVFERPKGGLIFRFIVKNPTIPRAKTRLTSPIAEIQPPRLLPNIRKSGDFLRAQYPKPQDLKGGSSRAIGQPAPLPRPRYLRAAFKKNPAKKSAKSAALPISEIYSRFLTAA